MNSFGTIMYNKVFISAFFAWFFAQGFKVLKTLIVNRRFDFERVMGAGGMPSSHSATVMAATIATGQMIGYDHPAFGVAIVFSFVVMYDASGIRRAAGKQAKILNSIVDQLRLHQEIDYNEKLKELLGHTHLEVFVGALLGILIGILVTR